MTCSSKFDWSAYFQDTTMICIFHTKENVWYLYNNNNNSKQKDISKHICLKCKKTDVLLSTLKVDPHCYIEYLYDNFPDFYVELTKCHNIKWCKPLSPTFLNQRFSTQGCHLAFCKKWNGGNMATLSFLNFEENSSFWKNRRKTLNILGGIATGGKTLTSSPTGTVSLSRWPIQSFFFYL